MKEYLKRVKIEHVVQALVTIVIGVIMILKAEAVIPVMARVLAALLIIVGILLVVSFFAVKQRGILASGQFAAGILIAAVGVWIFLNPGPFTNFIPKIFGAFIVISGLNNLAQAFSLIRYKYSYWWIALILGIITLSLGGWLIVKSSEATVAIVQLIGVFLAYDGISNLWTISRITKYGRAVDQAIRDLAAVDSSAEIVNTDSAEK